MQVVHTGMPTAMNHGQKKNGSKMSLTQNQHGSSQSSGQQLATQNRMKVNINNQDIEDQDQ